MKPPANMRPYYNVNLIWCLIVWHVWRNTQRQKHRIWSSQEVSHGSMRRQWSDLSCVSHSQTIGPHSGTWWRNVRTLVTVHQEEHKSINMFWNRPSPLMFCPLHVNSHVTGTTCASFNEATEVLGSERAQKTALASHVQQLLAATQSIDNTSILINPVLHFSRFEAINNTNPWCQMTWVDLQEAACSLNGSHINRLESETVKEVSLWIYGWYLSNRGIWLLYVGIKNNPSGLRGWVSPWCDHGRWVQLNNRNLKWVNLNDFPSWNDVTKTNRNEVSSYLFIYQSSVFWKCVQVRTNVWLH